MSIEQSLRDAGRRLATDLRELREKKEVDVEALLKATRLPPDILEKFDESALVDHPAFNRVYLRSIVTTYATLLEINRDDVLAALEDALEGRYENSLRLKYLNDGQEGLVGRFVGVSDSIVPSSPNKPGRSKRKTADRARSVLGRNRPQKPAATPEKTAQAKSPDQSSDRNWGDLAASESGSDAVDSIAAQGNSRYLLIAAGIILIPLLVWVWPNPSPDGEETSAGDAIALNIPNQNPPAAETVPPARVVLSDSMRFVISATTEEVDPIRITRDRWARRPYWIEPGDSLVFSATNRIIFESDIESARITLEGYVLPDSLADASGKIDLDRARAQRWLDAAIMQQSR